MKNWLILCVTQIIAPELLLETTILQDAAELLYMQVPVCPYGDTF